MEEEGLARGAGSPPPHDLEWDAGAMGCGELVLELRFRLADLAPGTVLRLQALDPGAVEDIPAWCAMTRHELVDRDHPLYWIRRRKD